MNITIPPEALEAGARASYEDWVSICVTSGGVPEEYRAWDDLEDGERDEWRDHARAACLAMLRAWPGMKTEHLSSWVMEAVWRVAMMTYHREIRRNPERAWQLAIAAALTTWPHIALSTHVEEGRRIILPLPPQEGDA